jgi:hypothetical protein
MTELLARVRVGGKDGPGWSPTVFDEDGPRSKDRAKAVSLIVLDVEKGKGEGDKSPPPLEEALTVCELVQGWAAIGHTTHSHTQDNPRYRLVLRPDRDMRTGELPAVTRAVLQRLGLGDCCDAAASEGVARLF